MKRGKTTSRKRGPRAANRREITADSSRRIVNGMAAVNGQVKKEHPHPPPEWGGCYMYRVEHRKVGDNKRITDPVEFARATVESLAKWLCKRGLLKPASKRAQQYPPRPFAFVAIGKRVYSVRLPTKPDEEFMVNELQELDARVRHFAKCFTNKQCEDAVWDAIEIGALAAMIEATQYDRAVKYGRSGLDQLTKCREAAIANQRKDRAPVHQEIITLLERGLTWGQIEQKGVASRSTIARVARKYRNTSRKK